MRNIYIDFEYIENKTKTYYALICCSIYDYRNDFKCNFDLRFALGSFREYLLSLDTSQVRFIGYNITTAEVPVLCQIMGHEWVMNTSWIDLWAEFKMFALTHPDYFTNKTGLANAIKILGIEDKYSADKESTRSLILYSEAQLKVAEKQRKTRLETGEFDYTHEQYEKITYYCDQDVLILPEVVRRLNEISKPYDIKLEERVNRGRHCQLAGVAYSRHRGYPMDVDRVKIIFENIPKIKESIQIHCNEQTGINIYEPQYKGPQRNKYLSHYQFNMKNFAEYLKTKGLYEDWAKTDTGLLRLDEDYIDEMLSAYRDTLLPVKTARDTIKQLNSTNLASLLTQEGYIKSVAWPYNQKTSRTSPKPKLGFILNLTPWLRMLIKPKPGRAFVGIDFKSQEVLIGACLSTDGGMLEDYLTDIYLGQAIKTGFAPPNATKKTHEEFRNAFKPIVLGTQFGMQAKKLSFRFYSLYQELGKERGQKHLLEKSLEECLQDARLFLDNLREAYPEYYEFLETHIQNTSYNNYYKSLDNWFYFTDYTTRPTQIVNVPCQSNGAAMTRLAHDECVRRGIDVITLHDAIYFECLEEEALPKAKLVSKIMVWASAQILGYDHMSTETCIYTHDTPYYDRRGESVYRFIMEKLQLDCPKEFKKPNEIKDIHNM